MTEPRTQHTNHCPVCPYCGEEPMDYWEYRHIHDDHGKEFDNREFECPDCLETYLISARQLPHDLTAFGGLMFTQGTKECSDLEEDDLVVFGGKVMAIESIRQTASGEWLLLFTEGYEVVSESETVDVLYEEDDD